MNTASKEEREQFSERLRQALRNSGYNDKSSTRLREAYSILDPKATITVHAARKWIVGEAIPTQSKLKILSEWLGVSAAWLRFGDATEQLAPTKRTDGLSSIEIKVLAQLRLLSPDDFIIVTKLIRRLAESNHVDQASLSEKSLGA